MGRSDMKLNAIEKILLHNPVRRVAQQRYEAPMLLGMTGPLEVEHALDIGCGSGWGMRMILETLGGWSVGGVDVDPRMVVRAQKRIRRYGARAEVSVGDVTASPAEDQSFDVVFDFSVLHHVESWEDGVREVARVLKPNGLFVFREA